MDLFFRMNNTRNCSLEVLEYLIFHISPRKCFGCSGEQRYDFQRERPYARMLMNTSHSRSCYHLRPLPFFHIIHTCSRLFDRNHAPESGRVHNDTTETTQPSRKCFDGRGGDRFFDRDGSLQMDFLALLFATEFHMCVCVLSLIHI